MVIRGQKATKDLSLSGNFFPRSVQLKPNWKVTALESLLCTVKCCSSTRAKSVLDSATFRLQTLCSCFCWCCQRCNSPEKIFTATLLYSLSLQSLAFQLPNCCRVQNVENARILLARHIFLKCFSLQRGQQASQISTTSRVHGRNSARLASWTSKACLQLADLHALTNIPRRHPTSSEHWRQRCGSQTRYISLFF